MIRLLKLPPKFLSFLSGSADLRDVYPAMGAMDPQDLPSISNHLGIIDALGSRNRHGKGRKLICLGPYTKLSP